MYFYGNVKFFFAMENYFKAVEMRFKLYNYI